MLEQAYTHVSPADAIRPLLSTINDRVKQMTHKSRWGLTGSGKTPTRKRQVRLGSAKTRPHEKEKPHGDRSVAVEGNFLNLTTPRQREATTLHNAMESVWRWTMTRGSSVCVRRAEKHGARKREKGLKTKNESGQGRYCKTGS